ncbi:MAG: hypothetical protein DI628_06350 [Blastochloris viridis]|uniref:Uncharacterized protein n=1 Tax=Blastochloris viridis TaxID=1079 RepID=A0A6N4RBT0_BLAVI|nr:MAG: hypothetical protein DI628_06350 [Blastochloris viridis]
MHVSIHTGRNKQPKRTRKTLRPAAANSGQKKLPHYVQAELQKDAEKAERLLQQKELESRNYNFEAEVAELATLKFSKHTPLTAATEAHQRLNKAIDFFNDNAIGYQHLAADIKRMKCLRAKYKLRLEASSAPQGQLDEAA